jgi:hypothetical protein
MKASSGTHDCFGGIQKDGLTMNSEDFQALARRSAIDALKALAAIAVDSRGANRGQAAHAEKT